MSRHDSDVDAYDWLNGSDLPANATCPDCGAEFSRVDDDPGPHCDACCDKRDAWAKAYDLRMELTRVKDVA